MGILQKLRPSPRDWVTARLNSRVTIHPFFVHSGARNLSLKLQGTSFGTGAWRLGQFGHMELGRQSSAQVNNNQP